MLTIIYLRATFIADAQSMAWLEKEYPEFSSGKALKQLQAAAREELASTGMSPAEIDHHWNFGILRSPAAQQMVAHAAYRRLQKQTAQEVRQNNRRHIPRAQAPGVFAPSSGDHDAEISNLQRQLDGQTGRAAQKTAVQLTQAMRRAGRLSAR